jgi:hypothetical protein
MTHKFIGTKVITAWHQEKDGKSGMAVKYEDGYTSWSPDEAFKPAYRVAEGPNQYLTFGDAVHFLKLGKRVARRGWNGKGMWLAIVEGCEYMPKTDNGAVHALGCEKLPWIGMKTADHKFVPWLASQTDVLAEDWTIMEGN